MRKALCAEEKRFCRQESPLRGGNDLLQNAKWLFRSAKVHFSAAVHFSCLQWFISLPQCIFLPARVHFLSATFLFLSAGGYFRSAEGFSWLHGFISLPQGLFLVCKGVFPLYALAFPGWTGLFPGHSKLFFAMVIHFPAYKPLFLSLCDRFLSTPAHVPGAGRLPGGRGGYFRWTGRPFGGKRILSRYGELFSVAGGTVAAIGVCCPGRRG